MVRIKMIFSWFSGVCQLIVVIFILLLSTGCSTSRPWETGQSNLHYSAVFCSSFNDVYVSGGRTIKWGYPIGGAQYVYDVPIIRHYDGIKWETSTLIPKSLGFVRGIWGSSANNVFFVGNEIFHFDDESWTETDTSRPMTDIWGSGLNDVFAIGGAQFPIKAKTNAIIFHYDGSLWTEMKIPKMPMSEYLTGIWGSGPTDVFAVGTTGIIHYDGYSWRDVVKSGHWRDIWGSGPNDVFVIPNYGSYILHYNGAKWTKMALPGRVALRGVGGSGPADVFAVGINEVIFHYDGKNWDYINMYK